MKNAVVLCILDGWGHRENGPDNAIARAHTPHWEDLIAHSSHTLLEASELNVGLPTGQMGNSEVGHMNIGAGRVLFQDLPRIDQAIDQHTLEEMAPLKEFITQLKASQGTCHLLGLLSPGGIHSHERHIFALAEILNAHGIPVALHAFLDGRDTPPKSAEASLKALSEHPAITLATMGGRYFAMDRDKRWDRIEKAYEPMLTGHPRCQDALAYLKGNYQKGNTDEFIPPVALGTFEGMKDGDGLLMANFRTDRARQILIALLDPNFQEFKRSRIAHFAAALGMVEYATHLNPWIKALFPPAMPDHTLGDIIAAQGLKQLRLAETEKYAHVTFFFNGGREDVLPGEDRILIPSPDVATYDLKPEMSAHELTDRLVEGIESEKYALIVVNYANPDMVGHTGNLDATQKAIETVDQCLGRVKDAVQKTGATLIITADHGNAETMYDHELESPHTAHTLNPVPFLIYPRQNGVLSPGKLSDIAPTILHLLDISQPSVMTGTSCLELEPVVREI